MQQLQLAKTEEEKTKIGQTIASLSTEELTEVAIDQKMQQLEVEIMTRQRRFKALKHCYK